MASAPRLPYVLHRVPLGRGGFAVVFRAESRSDGSVVAFKRPKPGQIAVARLRREIEVQQSLAHPNIMPILDTAPDMSWFTMPVAEGNLSDLRGQLDEEDLAAILLSVADALSVAHDETLVHRDISPGNILALPSSGPGGRRWVVADWGLVRRPTSETSMPLTRSGEGIGTAGFAAPEIWLDGTAATPAADVYSLGRVAAWFLTGTLPQPGQELLPEGEFQHWRGFIRACTHHDPSLRPPTMPALRELFQRVFALKDQSPQERARILMADMFAGQDGALEALAVLAEDHSENAAVYLDYLARVPTGTVRRWTSSHSRRAAGLAQQMASHLIGPHWDDRDPAYAATPLAFVHHVLLALIQAGATALAEDVAEGYFRADAQWRHGTQRVRTLEWLATLDGPAASAMARALAHDPQVRSYYASSNDVWQPRSPTLRRLLTA